MFKEFEIVRWFMLWKLGYVMMKIIKNVMFSFYYIEYIKWSSYLL